MSTHNSFFSSAALGCAAVQAGQTPLRRLLCCQGRNVCAALVVLKPSVGQCHLLSPSVHSGRFLNCPQRYRGLQGKLNLILLWRIGVCVNPMLALGKCAHLRAGIYRSFVICRSWDVTPKRDSSSWVLWEARGRTLAAWSTTSSAASLSSSTVTGWPTPSRWRGISLKWEYPSTQIVVYCPWTEW